MFHSRSTSSRRSKRERVKELPWAVLLQSGLVLTRHWRRLSAKERARLTGLARGSRGRLSNLSEKERAELGKLARKLDIKGMGRELAGVRRGGRARRRRCRGARA